jgi:hypothetical protein
VASGIKETAGRDFTTEDTESTEVEAEKRRPTPSKSERVGHPGEERRGMGIRRSGG